jgi:hypothetical protein
LGGAALQRCIESSGLEPALAAELSAGDFTSGAEALKVNCQEGRPEGLRHPKSKPTEFNLSWASIRGKEVTRLWVAQRFSAAFLRSEAKRL